MPGFDTGSVMYALNVDFTGNSLTSGSAQVTSNGQLLIGSTALPNIQVGTLTSPLGTLTIGYSSPNITIDANGAKIGETITGNTGGALSPILGNWNLPGNNTANNGFATWTSGSANTLTINSHGVAKWVVNPNGTGTHITVASAMASASPGDTIFIVPGTYTENVTLKNHVDITGFNLGGGSGAQTAIVGNLIDNGVSINTTISNITLQTNSANILTLTGAASSIILDSCILTLSNNTGISVGSGSTCRIHGCTGDVGTTGISIITGAGVGLFDHCYFTNSGSSTTATSMSGNCSYAHCGLASPLACSGTAIITIQNTVVDCTLINTTAVTTAGTGSTSSIVNSYLASGTASGISVGTGTTLTVSSSSVSSTNTNAVTGLGTLVNAGIAFTNTSSLINTTTVTARNFDVGGISFDGGTDVLSSYVGSTSFTPTLVGGSTAGTTSYSTQAGSYVKVGGLVFVQGNIVITSATGTGSATIGGLPFTINASNPNPIGTINLGGAGWAWPASMTMMSLSGQPNTVTAIPVGSGSSAATSSLQMSNAALTLRFSMVYQV